MQWQHISSRNSRTARTVLVKWAQLMYLFLFLHYIFIPPRCEFCTNMEIPRIIQPVLCRIFLNWHHYLRRYWRNVGDLKLFLWRLCSTCWSFQQSKAYHHTTSLDQWISLPTVTNMRKKIETYKHAIRLRCGNHFKVGLKTAFMASVSVLLICWISHCS